MISISDSARDRLLHLIDKKGEENGYVRVGVESGAGLGLFLAKSAADALGATITLNNRTDGHTGCVGTLTLLNSPVFINKNSKNKST